MARASLANSGHCEQSTGSNFINVGPRSSLRIGNVEVSTQGVHMMVPRGFSRN